MAWDGTTQEKYRRDAERYESDPADAEWEVTGPPVPPRSRPGRRRTTDLRGVPDAIRHMPATGCQWRAVPGRFPPSTTARDHLHPWCGSGVPGRMPGALRGLARNPGGRSPEPTAAGTGSQSVRTVETAGPSGYDAGKKARGGGRNVAAGVGGTPIAVRARTADIRDRDGAPDTVPGMPGKAPEVRRVCEPRAEGRPDRAS